MRILFAFLRKEMMEQTRSGKLLFLGILFVLFGIMNPAVAKLTPWLLEVMSESLASSGMTVTAVTVSAMDSWIQFFKNAPMMLIAYILLQSSIFTGEYQSGTLLLTLTRGAARHRVVLSKTVTLLSLWTAGYWLCFLITYGYNAYFWDNGVAAHLLFSVVCWYVFGVMTVALTVLFSTLFKTNIEVMGGTGAVVLISYLIGFLPKMKEYMPTRLTDGNSLIAGKCEPEEYAAAFCAAAVISVVCLAASVPIFNKKQL